MQWYRFGSVGLVLAVAPVVAFAATLSGSITYDGTDVMSAFGGPMEAQVSAFIVGASGTVYQGSVDLQAGSYSVSGLPTGTAVVTLEVDRSDPANGAYGDPADLWGQNDAEVTSEGQEIDLDGEGRSVILVYTPRKGDGIEENEIADVYLPPGGCSTFDDVLGTVFGLEGAGSLEVRGSDLVVMSRTSTPAPGGGSFGQGIPPVAAHQLLRADLNPTAVAGGVFKTSEFRTNLGFVEVWGERATVEVTLLDAQGSVLGTKTVRLKPFSSTQINDLPGTVGSVSGLVDGMVELELISGNGRVGAYLSIGDEATGDPTYLPIGHAEPSTVK